MKLLSIGNSFSTDAQKWLHQIAASCGDDLYVVNLYIAGCSLEMHSNNFDSEEKLYDYEVNGEFVKKVSLKEGIKSNVWDAVTFQQVSHQCGDYSAYQPYLDELYDKVRSMCPDAEVYIHQTWAYEKDTNHPGFANYENSQNVMHNCLVEAYNKAATRLDVPIIPVGEVIDYIRKNVAEFDYGNGGMSLCRDTFHLSYIYGRFAAGLVWYYTFLKKDVRNVTFCPKYEGETADENLLTIIKNAVYTALNK